jgi:glycosyltransferase involved in cell wall biosynthesis
MANLAKARSLFKKIKWLLYVSLTSVVDFFLSALSIPAGGKLSVPNSNQRLIVYVGGSLYPRIPRLAKWTKKNGDYVTVLLCRKEGYFEKYINKDIEHTILFRNKWHLKRIIKNLPAPYIVHGFAPKSDYPYFAMNFFKKYHPGVPFVADYQDVYAVYYGITPTQRWLKHELPFEKECLQHADAIVAHSLEPCEGMKLWHIKTKAKRLYFPLYCDNDEFCNQKQPLTDDNIHLVYAGGVVASYRDKSHYGDTQFHWLIDILSKQKIHFHIYPSPVVPKFDREEYEEMARNNPYFHYHPTISQEELPEEISKYHYGIMPFFRGFSNQSELKRKYATTLKLFNYLEAGLPILVGSGVDYQGWMIERYKLGMVINKPEDFNTIRQQINSVPYSTQLENVLKNRQELSLQKHIPSLIKLYNSLG